MHWLKRDIWKAGIAIAGMLPLLTLWMWMMVLVVWAPVSAADAHERVSGLAGPGTVTLQTPSTADLTVTAVVQDQFKQQDEKSRRDNSFPWTILNIFGSSAIGGIGTICIAVAAFVTANNGLKQWKGNREDEQKKRDEEQARWQAERKEEDKKRDEERYQKVVEGLGSERVEARVGAAIMLRTFLQQGYEQFHRQTFDLAVAHLCLPRTSGQEAYSSAPPPLSQALIVIFKKAYPLVRNQNTEGPQYMDATGIQLDDAYLREADLKQVWMPYASLRHVNLSKADLSGADLRWAALCETSLFDTFLDDAILIGAVLHKAKIMRASLYRTNLASADLSGADLTLATLKMVNLQDANLSGADLEYADFSETNLEDVLTLQGTNMRGVKGLDDKQKAACKARGAIFDEDTTTSPPQPIISSPPPSQSSSAQAPSVSPDQVNMPASSTDGSSSTSSEPSSQS